MTQYREIVCKSALNRVHGMGFGWSLNPYQGCFHSCVYCFARSHAKLADRDPGEGFSSNIGVKINVAKVLSQELSRKSWRGDPVVLGTATDPYQPIEGRYRLTRQCLELFARHRTPIRLITKGTLIVRDIDVLVELAKKTHSTISFSVPTLDEAVWLKTEPGTPPPKQRLRALKKLVQAGVVAGVGMAPILPNISDSFKQLRAVVMAAAESGACFLWGEVLNLKPGTREYFFEFLGKEYPELFKTYDSLFTDRIYLPNKVRMVTTQYIASLKRSYPIQDRRPIQWTVPDPPAQLSLWQASETPRLQVGDG